MPGSVMEYNLQYDITSEKISSIGDLVEEIRTRYGESNIDLDQLARDNNIHVIEDERFLVPSVYRYKRQYYLCMNKAPQLDQFVKAHEIGHVLLKHLALNKLRDDIEENEADYFAKEITGINPQEGYCMYKKTGRTKLKRYEHLLLVFVANFSPSKFEEYVDEHDRKVFMKHIGKCSQPRIK